MTTATVATKGQIMTEELDDPVESLCGLQLGRGTDYNQAGAYARALKECRTIRSLC